MGPLGRLALAALRGYSWVAPTQRGGYRLVRLGRKFVPREQWRGTFVTPDASRLDLDLSTYPDCCMAVGLYELDTLRLIRRVLRRGDHFVDCGANLGYFTLAAARAVGERGRVDAFEPDPINRARLERHLEMNGSPAHVRVHPVAVADQAGEATLYHPVGDARNHGEASLFAPSGVATQAYTVPTGRLDQLVSGKPRLVKMDVEGAELTALRGMRGWLSGEGVPQLIVEHNPESAAAGGFRAGDLFRLLCEHEPRYHAYWVGWRMRELRTAEEIDSLARQGNILYRRGRLPDGWC
jgi:FkbM family methyltransferase